jgi:hypothetical protein
MSVKKLVLSFIIIFLLLVGIIVETTTSQSNGTSDTSVTPTTALADSTVFSSQSLATITAFMTPATIPVPTQVITNITPDASGLYHGDTSSNEETQTFLEITPWIIAWKCSDTVGSMMFTIDSNEGIVLETDGPYQCTTSAQKIVINTTGLLRIGAVPLDMDGWFVFGTAFDN